MFCMKAFTWVQFLANKVPRKLNEMNSENNQATVGEKKVENTSSILLESF